jgi:DNA polymerase III sliding clamp (beta) subunit (PCNA family)
MDKNFLRAIKALRQKKPILSILNYGRIENNILTITNLDDILRLSCPAPSGMADLSLLCATGDVPAAQQVAKNTSTEDFPIEPDFNNSNEYSKPDIFSANIFSDLSSLLPATSKYDYNCSVLEHIFLSCENEEAVATNGHILFTKKVSSLPCDLLVSARFLKILSCLPPPDKICVYHHFSISAEGEKTPEHDFILIMGPGYIFISKARIDPYPLYKKVTPKYTSKKTIWTSENVSFLSQTIKTLLPFAQEKSHMFCFTTDKIIVHNRETNIIKTVSLPFSFPNLPGNGIIGLNGKYLLSILDFIGKNPVTIQIGPSLKQPVLFTLKKSPLILMPLSTSEGDSGITMDQLLAGESDF